MHDPPLDSIDGLRLTFEHLTKYGQRLARFRAEERARAGNLTEEERQEMFDALGSATTASDATQEKLRKLLGT